MGSVRFARVLVGLCVVAMMAGARGVAFSAPSRNHTLFQSLKVTGQMRTGGPLAAHLTYQQYLPIDIDVRCELRQDKKLVKVIGQGTVSEDPGGSPKAPPFPAASVQLHGGCARRLSRHLLHAERRRQHDRVRIHVHGAGIATPAPK